MSKHAAANRQAISSGLRDFSRRIVKPQIEAMLRQVAQLLVSYIDGAFTPPRGTRQFPVDTGNLHDATGVGVYIDGRLSAYLPTAMATDQQSYRGQIGIDGALRLRNAVQGAATRFSSGIWIVLFSTVPYAYSVNAQGSPRGRGAGFFDGLAETLFQNLTTGLRPISAL